MSPTRQPWQPMHHSILMADFEHVCFSILLLLNSRSVWAEGWTPDQVCRWLLTRALSPSVTGCWPVAHTSGRVQHDTRPRNGNHYADLVGLSQTLHRWAQSCKLTWLPPPFALFNLYQSVVLICGLQAHLGHMRETCVLPDGLRLWQ